MYLLLSSDFAYSSVFLFIPVSVTLCLFSSCTSLTSQRSHVFAHHVPRRLRFADPLGRLSSPSHKPKVCEQPTQWLLRSLQRARTTQLSEAGRCLTNRLPLHRCGWRGAGRGAPPCACHIVTLPCSQLTMREEKKEGRVGGRGKGLFIY